MNEESSNFSWESIPTSSSQIPLNMQEISSHSLQSQRQDGKVSSSCTTGNPHSDIKHSTSLSYMPSLYLNDSNSMDSFVFSSSQTSPPWHTNMSSSFMHPLQDTTRNISSTPLHGASLPSSSPLSPPSSPLPSRSSSPPLLFRSSSPLPPRASPLPPPLSPLPSRLPFSPQLPLRSFKALLSKELPFSRIPRNKISLSTVSHNFCSERCIDLIETSDKSCRSVDSLPYQTSVDESPVSTCSSTSSEQRSSLLLENSYHPPYPLPHPPSLSSSGRMESLQTREHLPSHLDSPPDNRIAMTVENDAISSMELETYGLISVSLSSRGMIVVEGHMRIVHPYSKGKRFQTESLMNLKLCHDLPPHGVSLLERCTCAVSQILTRFGPTFRVYSYTNSSTEASLPYTTKCYVVKEFPLSFILQGENHGDSVRILTLEALEGHGTFGITYKGHLKQRHTDVMEGGLGRAVVVKIFIVCLTTAIRELYIGFCFAVRLRRMAKDPLRVRKPSPLLSTSTEANIPMDETENASPHLNPPLSTNTMTDAFRWSEVERQQSRLRQSNHLLGSSVETSYNGENSFVDKKKQPLAEARRERVFSKGKQNHQTSHWSRDNITTMWLFPYEMHFSHSIFENTEKLFYSTYPSTTDTNPLCRENTSEPKGTGVAILILPTFPNTTPLHSAVATLISSKKFNSEKWQLFCLFMLYQLIEVYLQLHATEIIHGDSKPDNFILFPMKYAVDLLQTYKGEEENVPISMSMNGRNYPVHGTKDFLRGTGSFLENVSLISSAKHSLLPPSCQLPLSIAGIDASHALDAGELLEGCIFKGSVLPNGWECPSIVEGSPWLYHVDIFGIAKLILYIIYGKEVRINKVKTHGNSQPNRIHSTEEASASKTVEHYEINESIPRSWDKTFWKNLFDTLLNFSPVTVKYNFIPTPPKPNLIASLEPFHAVGRTPAKKIDANIFHFNQNYYENEESMGNTQDFPDVELPMGELLKQDANVTLQRLRDSIVEVIIKQNKQDQLYFVLCDVFKILFPNEA